jgi:hypothetical protein
VAGVSVSFQPDIEVRAVVTVAPAAAAGAPAANFGITDIFKKDDTLATGAGSTVSVNATLKNFMDKLGDYLSKALDDASSLEISTYVASDMDTVQYEAGKFSGAQLRAVTRISIDGDTLVCVPEKDGETDTAVWDIHLEMVRAAQANRAELMRTIVSAATSIAGIVKQ